MRFAQHYRTQLIRLCAFILAFACSAAGQQRRALTVERIWGQPSLSGSLKAEVEWSPDGKRLSYLETVGSGKDAKTSLWAVDVASGERRVLVDAEKLEQFPSPPSGGTPASRQRTGGGRSAQGRYLWAPDGEALLLVSSKGLFWFDLKTQTATQLAGETPQVTDPKISPDGRWVSFVRDHDLWVVNVATGKAQQLTRGGRDELMNGQLDWVYPEELGIATAYWWSPDSARIAFLQMDQRQVTRYPLVNFLSPTGDTEWMRYPKAGGANPVVRVGVVSVKGGRVRWMDVGKETDIYIARVNWLPDSRRIAIQRLNRAQTKLELLFAAASTGRTQVVLTEEDPYWVNVHDDLYFFQNQALGGFLWASEGSGYRHLYLYDLSGKQLRQVTGGDWEVTQVEGVNENEGAVYFAATEKSPLERHLYKVSLTGGIVSRLTRDDGTHSAALSPDARHFVDAYSNVMTPPRQDLYRVDGTRTAVIAENSVPELAAYGLQPVEFFKVRGADGSDLNAMMIKPPDFDPAKKYPVLIYTYGGPHGQVVSNSWGRTRFLWHQMMAQKGYIVFSLDNRGSVGRGHKFESQVYKKFGENELADQLAGVAYLKSLPYVDGGRIGIWGWSYGGYMTCYAMANAPDAFKAGFAGAPVTDWLQYDTIYTERYMKRPQENAEGYKKSSPVNQAGQLKGKLLIAHGTGDDNVHFANTVELTEEFIKAGKYAELMIYPARGHGISDTAAQIHLFRRVAQFFLDNL